MPQVGQSRPVIVGEAQGRSPSWVCVPNPAGPAPTSSPTPRAPPVRPPRPEADSESANPVGDDRTSCRIMGGPPLEWTIANGSVPIRKGLGKEIGTYSKTADPGKASRSLIWTAKLSVRQVCVHQPLAIQSCFDPRFGFEHGGLHASLDFAAAGLDRIAVGVGGHDDGFGHDAGGRAERSRNAKAVPAPGPPRVS